MLMIRYHYRNLRSKHLSEIPDYRQGSWVYVEDPSELEIEQLCEQFELDRGLIDDALDMDEVPRVEAEAGLSYIYTRFPYTDEKMQITTAPMLFVQGPKLFITVSLKPLPQLEKLLAREDVFTTQQLKLMLQIMNRVTSQYERYLTRISRQILATRNRLRVQSIANKDFVEFVTIEDVLNEFLGALLPTNTILRRLLNGKLLKLYDEDEDLVEDLFLSNEQFIESAKSNIKTITSIREAYSTIAANNLNQVIRLLTSVTVILTIPTMVASFYGMNVALPGANNPQAAGLIIIGTLLATAGLVWLFKKRGWL
jgi:magnesium transporter